MFVVVDLKISNLQSVLEALKRVGANVSVAQGPADVSRASAVIVPGVGAFGDGMESLSDQGLIEPLRLHALEKRKPIIGICLGMQLLGEESEEFGLHKGLGLIQGRVKKLQPLSRDLRIPNMGWCDVKVTNPDSVLFSSFRGDTPVFYFAHSYYVECKDPADTAATLEFGDPIPASIEHDNIFGLQFHPEKSQGDGLEVLSSFARYVEHQNLWVSG